MKSQLLPAFSFLFILSLTIWSCQDKVPQEKKVSIKDTHIASDSASFISTKIEALSPVERKYFKRFKKEEDFYITDSVIRYSRIENGKSVNFLNEFIYKRDVADLIGGIYMYYSMSFSPILTADSDPFVNYSFRAGNASAGNGSIVKMGDKIILTQTGCGTSCTTFVKENGKKVYEKIE
jgi:hypothetical protein